MSSEEFTHWIALRQIEPFPERRADIRSAIVAHASAAPHVKNRLSIDDFMPSFGERKQVTAREGLALFMAQFGTAN